MRFTGTYTGLLLDLSKYQQQLEDYLVAVLQKGAKAWLQIVAGRGGRVPLWSGMARASLLELSQLISGTVVLSPLKAKSRVSQGRTLGTAKLEISPTKTQLTINSNVPHYALQEYRNVGVSPTAPWQSFLAGNMAFQLVAKDAKLPKPIFKPIKMRIK